VVVREERGAAGRLLWSPGRQHWLPAASYGPGFANEQVDPDSTAPSSEDLARVLHLGAEFATRGCQRCGLTGLDDHLIAPDVYGQLTRYCVQLPDPTVVCSFGGTGDRKHWGSPYGCSAVRPGFRTTEYGEEQVEYGEGLIAARVRDWDWCVRCAQTAATIARSAAAVDLPAATYVENELSQLLTRRSQNRLARRSG